MLRIAKFAAMALALLIASRVEAAPENRMLWYDDEDAAQFVTALRERNIPFRRDSEGGIWYPASRVAAVDEISAAVRGRCTPGLTYDDPRDQTSFARQLEGAGIPFKQCRRFGKVYLSWEPKFNDRAMKVAEAVDDESIRRSNEERARARK